MSKASLTYIWGSIPEHSVLVKRGIDLYNKMSEYLMQPEPAEPGKEAL
jgi:hypothetical protein